MRIKLNTNFAASNSELKEIELPPGIRTIRDLLGHVGRQINFDFFKAVSGELDTDLELLLNEKEIWFYPKGVDRELNEGDSVIICLIPLGGG